MEHNGEMILERLSALGDMEYKAFHSRLMPTIDPDRIIGVRTPALRRLAKEQPVYAYDFKGHRYDVGTKAGFIQANIEFALRDDSLKNEMKSYLDALHQYMDVMLQYE